MACKRPCPPAYSLTLVFGYIPSIVPGGGIFRYPRPNPGTYRRQANPPIQHRPFISKKCKRPCLPARMGDQGVWSFVTGFSSPPVTENDAKSASWCRPQPARLMPGRPGRAAIFRGDICRMQSLHARKMKRGSNYGKDQCRAAGGLSGTPKGKAEMRHRRLPADSAPVPQVRLLSGTGGIPGRGLNVERWSRKSRSWTY